MWELDQWNIQDDNLYWHTSKQCMEIKTQTFDFRFKVSPKIKNKIELVFSTYSKAKKLALEKAVRDKQLHSFFWILSCNITRRSELSQIPEKNIKI